MVLSEAIRDFGLYSRHRQGHTKKTFKSYQHGQRHFLGWLAEQGHPDPDLHEISPTLIRRYSYARYVRSFIRIKGPQIAEYVQDQLQHGRLRSDTLVQLGPWSVFPRILPIPGFAA